VSSFSTDYLLLYCPFYIHKFLDTSARRCVICDSLWYTATDWPIGPPCIACLHQVKLPKFASPSSSQSPTHPSPARMIFKSTDGGIFRLAMAMLAGS
jgi:hypothetical protein